MTKGHFTEQELLQMKLLKASGELSTLMLIDLINKDKSSTFKSDMAHGVNYYNILHDIRHHRQFYYVDKVRHEDKSKANHKLPHPFHKILVDQKVAYIAGNPVVVSVPVDESKSKSEDKVYNDDLNDLLGDDFNDLINDWITNASNKGEEWLHPYINPKGEFDYVIIPAEEIIAIYDSVFEKDLIGIIRYYQYELIRKDQEKKKLYKAEYWTKDKVEYFVQLEDLSFVRDLEHPINPAGHWQEYNSLNKDNKKQVGWGQVPFIRLQNNSQSKTDLIPIKGLVDAYDKVKSDWINDLSDFQELIYVLKGYNGLRADYQEGLSELGIFIDNLKTNKAITVDEDGGVDTLRAEIPVEAKEKFLTMTREEIFYFGEGVDVNTDKFGNSPSGVSLKFLYSSLDLKANRLMRKLTKAIKEFTWFVTEFINLDKKKQYTNDSLIITYNKSIIFNEKEKIESITNSVDLSMKTRLENHPYVNDVEEEFARKKAEAKDEEDDVIAKLNQEDD